MIDASDVTAVLITRGDQPGMMRAIQDTLLDYDDVIVWDNSVRENHRILSRYIAMWEGDKDVCYAQDDDCLVPLSTQQALLDNYEPAITATYAHGNNDGGYGDLPMPPGGALYDRRAAEAAIDAYVHEYGPLGRDEESYADFIVGVQVPFKQLHLPFHIEMSVAQHPSRLCNQPWAADAKARVTARARAIRDAA